MPEISETGVLGIGVPGDANPRWVRHGSGGSGQEAGGSGWDHGAVMIRSMVSNGPVQIPALTLKDYMTLDR